MQKSGLFIIVHVGLLLLAVGAAIGIYLFPEDFGRLSLNLRVLLTALPVGLALVGVRPLIAFFSGRPVTYLMLVCLPVLALVPWYYFVYLPSHAAAGLTGEHLASSLITQGTSNAIVEIGFANPIYTPTLSLTNDSLYTTEVDVYLRIRDGTNAPTLFRAVRDVQPDARLTTEASVRGFLSENPGYLFIPVVLPPRKTVMGRVVFVISDLTDGSTFSDALDRGYPAEFEVRDPETGELLLGFPMARM